MGKRMLLLKMCFVIVAVIAIIVICASASVQEFSKAFAGDTYNSLSLLIGGILAVVAVAFFILLASLLSVVTDKRREFRHAFAISRFLKQPVKTITRAYAKKKVARLRHTETSYQRRRSRSRRCQRVARKKRRLRNREGA